MAENRCINEGALLCGNFRWFSCVRNDDTSATIEMMRNGTTLALGVFCRSIWAFWILAILSIAPWARAAPPDNLVRPQLVSAATAVEPGKPLTIGLHLIVTDGWHIYWTNPGDAGAATTFKISVPEGFKVEAVQYPVPEKLPQPGGLTIYAYEKELLLTATITPPADLRGMTSVPISALAGWCVCSDVCVLGKQKLDLDIPVAAAGGSKAQNGELFDAWRARAPASSDQAFKSIGVSWETEASGPVSISSSRTAHLTFAWRGEAPAKQFEWLPGPSDDLTVTFVSQETSGGNTQLTLKVDPIKGIPPTSATIDGILAYHLAGQPPLGVAVTLDRKGSGLAMPDQAASADAK
jgi:thiol:disulfide interchange protein DsbD